MKVVVPIIFKASFSFVLNITPPDEYVQSCQTMQTLNKQMGLWHHCQRYMSEKMFSGELGS